MIDFIKQSPPVYSKESRDYQLISRLLTALFSYSESYINNMSVYNDTINSKLSELRALTLNFIPKHQWPTDALNAVTSCFKYLMKYKGSLTAILACFYIILRFENIESEVDVKVSGNKIQVEIAENIEKIGAIKDLLDYIMPAGIDYEVVIVKAIKGLASGLVYEDVQSNSPIDNNKVTIRNTTPSIYDSEGSEKHTGYIYFNKVQTNDLKYPITDENKETSNE